MQHDTVPAYRVHPRVDAMKPFLFRRAPLQVDVARQAAQGAIDSDTALGRQHPAQTDHLLGLQRCRSIGLNSDCLLPLFQRPDVDATNRPRAPSGRFPLGRSASQENHGVDVPDIGHVPAQRRADPACLVRGALRLVRHTILVRFHPFRVPVLDLDDANPRRADCHDIDLVGLVLRGDRERQIRKQNPLVVAGCRLEAAADGRECRTLTFVGGGAARELRDLHGA